MPMNNLRANANKNENICQKINETKAKSINCQNEKRDSFA